MSTFPDPLLEEHKALFGVEQVYGLVMSSGSEGAYAALKEMLVKLEVDLMIACDVGGDFIAARANGDVLSPMMDAYALRALKELHRLGPAVPMVFCVFGLGTDGELPANARSERSLLWANTSAAASTRRSSRRSSASTEKWSSRIASRGRPT